MPPRLRRAAGVPSGLTAPRGTPYEPRVAAPPVASGGGIPDPIAEDTRLPARVWLAVLALLYLCHLVPLLGLADDEPRGFLWGDALYYALASKGLAERGSLDLAPQLEAAEIEAAVAEHQLARDTGGGLVLKHGSILPFLGAPFFILLGPRGLLVLNVLLTTGIVVGLMPLLRRYLGTVPALCTAYLLGTATLLSPYAYNYSADVAGTFFLVLGVNALFRPALLTAGILLGLAVSLKLSLLPAVAALLGGGWLLAILGGERPEGVRPAVLRSLRLGIGVLFGIAPLLALNASLFGSVWLTGYQRIALPGGGTVSHVSDFNQPLAAGLVQVLFDGTHGVLPSNPVLLLGLFGIPTLIRLRPWTRRREVALLVAAAALQLVVISRYDFWNQSHVSNRFLLVLVPLLAPLVGFAVDLLYRAARLDSEPRP